MKRRTVRSAIALLVLLAASLFPGAAAAQLLLGETSASFGWQPSVGDVEFYQVWVSRSSRSPGYELEQTVNGAATSAVVSAVVGEVLRVRVRAGNATEFGPMSPASAVVRFGLPPELPVAGTPGVVTGRAAGSDTDAIFFADRDTGATWRYSQTEPDQTPSQIGQDSDDRWQLVASGDFDGDGSEDLFWHHETGATRIWYVNGDSYEEELTPPCPDTTFVVELTGDFDGNGQDDLFWRDPVGPTLAWLRTAVEFTTFYFPPMPSETWEILTAGDFDGDGQDDLFWRNLDTVDVAIWFTGGSAETGVYARVRSSEKQALLWELAETRDEDGDGMADVRWQLAASPDVVEWWHMDAETVRPE